MDGFISYSHDDLAMMRSLRPHLKATHRALGVDFWSDERLSTGYDWNDEVQTRLRNSRVFVLLVTPAFVASDYIYLKELPEIRKRRIEDAALVLPVVVKRCSWQFVCGCLQAAPTKDGRLVPIADWHRGDHALDATRTQIENAIRDYFGLSGGPLDWQT